MWTKIRSNYRKSLKNRTYKSGDAATNQRPIKFEKELQFLNSFLENRSQISNLDSPTDDTQDSFTNSPPPSRPDSQVSSHSELQMPQRKTQKALSRSQKSHPQSQRSTTADILKEYIDSKKNEEEHPVDIFFKSMAVTLKTLPLRIQAEVKQNVLRIVNEAEIAYLSNTNQGTTGIMLSEQQSTARGYMYEPSTSTNSPLLSQANYPSTSTSTRSRSPLTYTPTPISRNHEVEEEGLEGSEFDYENL